MYTVKFVSYDGNVSAQVKHSEQDEGLWLAAGIDILDQHQKPVEMLMADVWYASEALKVSPEYYESQYGEDRYVRVLHFLDRLYTTCQEHIYDSVEVDY